MCTPQAKAAFLAAAAELGVGSSLRVQGAAGARAARLAAALKRKGQQATAATEARWKPGGGAFATARSARLHQAAVVAVAGSVNPASPRLGPGTTMPISRPLPFPNTLPAPIVLPTPIVLPAPTVGVTTIFPACSGAPPATCRPMAAVLPSPFLPTTVAMPSLFAAGTSLSLPAASVAAPAAAPAVVAPRPMSSRTFELFKLHQARQRQQFRAAGACAFPMGQPVLIGAAPAARGCPLQRGSGPEVVVNAGATHSAAPMTRQQHWQRQQQQQLEHQRRLSEHPDHDVRRDPQQLSGRESLQNVPHYNPFEEDAPPAQPESPPRTAAVGADPPQHGHHAHSQQPDRQLGPHVKDSCNPRPAEALQQPRRPSAAVQPRDNAARQPTEHPAQEAVGYDPWADEDEVIDKQQPAQEEWSPILHHDHQQQPDACEGQDPVQNGLLHTGKSAALSAAASAAAAASATAAVAPQDLSSFGGLPTVLLPITQTPFGKPPAQALPQYDPWEDSPSTMQPEAPGSSACVVC